MQAQESRLRGLLDTEVSEQIDAVYVREDTLVLVVRSSVWATRLRFLAPGVLERLNLDGSQAPIRHLRVVVGSREAMPPAYKRPAPKAPSAEAVRALSQTAAALPEDDPLRRSLERLAGTSRKRLRG